jgi:LmbE family N-acetylglucosaminyl deacetylase
MLRSLWSRPDAGHVVAVVAHPDDETIGFGGQLESIRDFTLIHVTDGAPRSRPDWRNYAEIRRAEVLAAVKIAGVPENRCLTVNLPDQEASAHLVELTCDLSRLFSQIRPDLVFTHAYEGGHPDHDATAFAVHHALQFRVEDLPAVIEFASYHRSPSTGSIEVGCFLREPAREPLEVVLNKREMNTKRRMLACFTSQSEALAQFRDDIECFRYAPNYDFTELPHPGLPYYESFNWGTTAAEWRRRAKHAQRLMHAVKVA